MFPLQGQKHYGEANVIVAGNVTVTPSPAPEAEPVPRAQRKRLVQRIREALKR